jgi:hypothetical protein
VAPQGEWTVLCSAPTGNPLTATLYGASGQTLPLDGWLGSSAGGRFVAFTHEDRWWLLDTQQWRVTDLGDWRIERRLSRSASPVGNLHFHPSLPRLAFVASDERGVRVVVLDLETLEESSFAAPASAVERLRWDPSGKALIIEDDPNPPKSKPPRAAATLPSPCALRQPLLLVDTSRQRPRRTTVLRLRDGQSSLGTGHLLELDGAAFAWTTDKDLVLRRDGSESKLLPRTCPSTVLGVHPGTETVLVGCADHGRLQLNLVSLAQRHALPVDIPQVYDLFDRVITTRLLPIYSGSKSYLVDFEQTKAWPLTDRDQLLAQAGSNVLLRRGDLVVRRHLDGPAEETLGSGVAAGARILLSPGYAYVAPRLYSARKDDSAPLVVPTTPLAIDARGCALLPTSIEPAGLPRGPVHWYCSSQH